MGRSIKDIATKQNLDWWKEFEETDEDIKWRIRSGIIASKVLLYLKRADSIDRTALAEKLEMSVQRLSKILKGKENLTLKSITRLEECTGLKLIQIQGEELKNNFSSIVSETYRGETEIIDNVPNASGRFVSRTNTGDESIYSGNTDSTNLSNNHLKVA